MARQAEEFATLFPSLACTEKLTQVKFAQGDKVANRRESIFDYLILLETAGDSFTVEESRLEKSRAQKEPPQALLATTGFAVMQVVFHPHFQPSFEFQEIAPDTTGGVVWRRIRFEHLPGHVSPTVLEVKGREYPIAWRGTAWVHPETGAIGRIQTELREPLADIGLESLTSTVEYGPGAAAVTVWVPRLAIVEARTAHQRWRNQHEFSAYRRFEVSSEQKVQEITKE
ncbi:hypothetical protein [Paludibaculum fermentans]|uniref:hypothetical protein n=1 Tax=Paludibaculum fermentans TaxID=1473598 RepID=UPI003EBA2213